jgi:hypothetical protein
MLVHWRKGDGHQRQTVALPRCSLPPGHQGTMFAFPVVCSTVCVCVCVCVWGGGLSVSLSLSGAEQHPTHPYTTIQQQPSLAQHDILHIASSLPFVPF